MQDENSGDNYLNKFKGGSDADTEKPGNAEDAQRLAATVPLDVLRAAVAAAENVQESEEIEEEWKESHHDADGTQALPASWDKPICQECGNEDDDGGGRYGVDDHDGLFFCGRCWKLWDGDDKENMMKPLYMQRRVRAHENKSQDDSNFFDAYKGGEGTDDIEGAWDPNDEAKMADGEQALPGSWERPICVECGRDEGDYGGGRYGHGSDSDKFYCGRCWNSWDEEDRRRMMMAYAPANRWMDPGRHSMDPMLHCPPPELPQFDHFGWNDEEDGQDEEDEDEDWGEGEEGDEYWNEEEEEEETQELKDDKDDGKDDEEEAETAD